VESLTDTLIKFQNPILCTKIINNSDIENAAIGLREKWNLGLKPITNVIETLEERA
jgi:hypothetical protein